GLERPDTETLSRASYVFACIDSVIGAITRGDSLPPVELLIIDECHHAAAAMYQRVIEATGTGRQGGGFLLGLTATPWRADGADIAATFGPPVVSIDLVTGMRRGFLASID